MNDKHNPRKPGSQKNESDNRPRPSRESYNNDSADYGERKGNIVTNTFSPPVRPGRGDNSGDKSGS
ncbi:hypothetical protein [Enterobacter chengduensis]|uniref:hypothetical protein n=1 Tax=Enterobacter chengduensis TaxID=2494701 RepID=UPI001495B6F6|nr:hypothetical protein [Enterobacter chengduensis]